MSKIQNFKRILIEDFKEEDRSVAEKIGGAVNVFAEEVTGALNKKITIDDNLDISKKDVSVSVTSDGSPSSTLQITTGLGRSCQGVIVIKVTNQTNPSIFPSGTPFISFVEYSSGIINVSNISNLVTANSYTLRLLLI